MSAGEHEKLKLSYISGRDVIRYIHFGKTVMQFLITLTINPAIPLVGFLIYEK